ncbi:MAG: hypothetical protein SFT81_00365 [Candidatus Caenarcaniphilales bacterium]|nr:hypothetical protein [Candidatus Caenarcaniphilales bacterium]
MKGNNMENIIKFSHLRLFSVIALCLSFFTSGCGFFAKSPLEGKWSWFLKSEKGQELSKGTINFSGEPKQITAKMKTEGDDKQVPDYEFTGSMKDDKSFELFSYATRPAARDEIEKEARIKLIGEISAEGKAFNAKLNRTIVNKSNNQILDSQVLNLTATKKD